MIFRKSDYDVPFFCLFFFANTIRQGLSTACCCSACANLALRFDVPLFAFFHQMPFSPPIHRQYARPEPMDSLRSLAISLEEEDRADLGGYIAVVLQKLANMNELLGERVSQREGCCPMVPRYYR